MTLVINGINSKRRRRKAFVGRKERRREGRRQGRKEGCDQLLIGGR